MQYRRRGRTKTQIVVNAVSSIITFQFQGWWLKHFCKQWPKPHQLQPIKIIQAAAYCLGPVVFVFRVFLHRGGEIVVIHTYLLSMHISRANMKWGKLLATNSIIILNDLGREIISRISELKWYLGSFLSYNNIIQFGEWWQKEILNNSLFAKTNYNINNGKCEFVGKELKHLWCNQYFFNFSYWISIQTLAKFRIFGLEFGNLKCSFLMKLNNNGNCYSKMALLWY